MRVQNREIAAATFRRRRHFDRVQDLGARADSRQEARRVYRL